MSSRELSTSPHVQSVLTAAYDPHSGQPTIIAQYPEPIVADLPLLASLMLPAQPKQQDWTTFFLYQANAISGGNTPNNLANMSKLEYNIRSEYKKSTSTRLHVLTLYNRDRAISIITHHSFFHIFKPLLVLGLAEANPQDALIRVYEAANSLDLTRLPHLNYFERAVLIDSEKLHLFEEKFRDGDLDAEHRDSVVSNATTLAMSDRKNSVATVGTIESQDSGFGRPSYFIDLKRTGSTAPQQSSSSAASTNNSTNNLVRDTHFFETKFTYNNSLKVPLRIPVDHHPEIVSDFSIINLVSAMLQITHPCETQHPELTTYGAYTPALLILINGLITQKRILFLGSPEDTGIICDRVLAACGLGSGNGLLRNFVAHAYPYVPALSDADEDIINSPGGYIAGTSAENAARLETNPSWWDILINLETGTLKISSATGVQGPSLTQDKLAAAAQQSLLGSMNPEDVAFLADLRVMVSDHFAEPSVRTRCRLYIKRFVRIATNYEDFKHGRTQLWSNPGCDFGYGYTWVSDTQRIFDLNCYSPVIEAWRVSKSYRYYIDEQKHEVWNPTYMKRITPGSDRMLFDFDYYLDKIRYQKIVDENESAQLYKSIAEHLVDDDDTIRFIASSSINNLFYVALGLFHRQADVRTATVRIIRSVEMNPTGHYFYTAMSQFQKVAYKRLLHDAVRDARVPTPGGPHLHSPQPPVIFESQEAVGKVA